VTGGDDDSDGDGEEGIGPQAFCVALYTLARHDTGLALFVWAQNVAAAAAEADAPDAAASWRAGEPVALGLDLELGAGAGLFVSSGARRGLFPLASGWRLRDGQAGAGTSLGVDGADLGAFVTVADASAGSQVQAPNAPLAVAGLAAVGAAVALRASQAAGVYAQVRQQFGHPIGDFQALRFMLADAHTGAEAARLLAFSAAGRAELAASARALSAAAAAARVAADVAVQVHGGAGYTRDYPAESLLRDASVLQHVARRRFEASALPVAGSVGSVGLVRSDG
jgi:alkylation response protein AidB-like acyl-CoA dehydrogenase